MPNGMRTQRNEVNALVKTVEKTMNTIEIEAERASKPVRRTLIRRFPVLAVLAITFGVSATATAGQLLFMKVEFFLKHPSVLLVIGLGTLIFMGKLHQKLG